MAKEFQFEEYRKRDSRYKEELAETRERLDEVSDELFALALNVAIAGPWARYNESSPDGNLLRFTPQTLFECPDPAVKAIMHSWEQVNAALEEIDSRLPDRRDRENDRGSADSSR